MLSIVESVGSLVRLHACQPAIPWHEDDKSMAKTCPNLAQAEAKFDPSTTPSFTLNDYLVIQEI